MNAIALFDLSYSFRRHWHYQAENAEVNDAARKTLNELYRVRDNYNHVIVCIDSPPYWRSEVYPEYKAQREKPSDGIISQMGWLKERIELDGFNIAGANGFEADDIIATIVGHLKDKASIRIISRDKDLAALVCRGTEYDVEMISPATVDTSELVIGVDEVKEKFGVFPFQVVELLALVGDSSDNVPGVKGIGAKTAAKLLQEYGDIDTMVLAFRESKEVGDKLSVREQSILDSLDTIALAKRLIRLRTDAPIDIDDLMTKKEPKPLLEEHTQEDSAAASEPPSEQETAQTGDTEQALAISRRSPDWEMELQPRDSKAAYAMCRVYVNSRMYQKFPTVDAMFTAVMRGRELGLGIGTSLDSFHVIQGRPVPTAQLIVSMAERSPDCEYIMMTESTESSCTYEAKNRRHPKPVTLTYTLDQAKAAGLAGNENWRKHPADMLRKTASVKLVRAVFPSACLGLYSQDELE